MSSYAPPPGTPTSISILVKDGVPDIVPDKHYDVVSLHLVRDDFSPWGCEGRTPEIVINDARADNHLTVTVDHAVTIDLGPNAHHSLVRAVNGISGGDGSVAIAYADPEPLLPVAGVAPPATEEPPVQPAPERACWGYNPGGDVAPQPTTGTDQVTEPTEAVQACTGYLPEQDFQAATPAPTPAFDRLDVGAFRSALMSSSWWSGSSLYGSRSSRYSLEGLVWAG